MANRTNLCTNPSFEVSTAGWSAFGFSPTIAQSATWADVGTKSLQVQSPLQSGGSGGYIPSGAQISITTVIGTQYTVAATIKQDTGGSFGGAPVVLTAAGQTSTQVAGDATAPTRISVTFTASATTTVVKVQSVWRARPAPFPFNSWDLSAYVDSVLIETPAAGTYFDGSFASCSWTGTAGLSTSVFTAPPGTITVNADPFNSPPRNLLYVNSVSGTQAQITRTDADGNIRAVRLGDPATLTSGTWVGYDYEVPYGTAVTYTVTPLDLSTPASVAAAPLAITQTWLVHPGVPGLSMPINGTLLTGADMDDGSAEHVILGREYPQIINDGARKSAKYQLSIRTQTDTENNRLDAILSGSAPLLLQMVFPFTTAAKWTYINVGPVNNSPVTLVFGDPKRVWTLPVTEIDRPVGGIAAQRTYADVAVEVASYSALLAKYATYTGVLTGIAGT
jgi:hypothetical protein